MNTRYAPGIHRPGGKGKVIRNRGRTAIPCRLGRLPWIVLAVLFFPNPLAPQLRSEIALATAPNGASSRLCSPTHHPGDQVLTTVLEVFWADEPKAWRPRIRALEDSLAAAAEATRSDLPTQYLYAAVLGARTEMEGGRTQVSKAIQLHRQVQRVLALDPGHTGAMYIQGRLNAAVMRLGGFKRFIATKLLGGGALSSASWPEARRLLEAAADGDPCVPEHHFELARVYVDTGHAGLALERLELAMALIAKGERGGKLERKALRLQRRLAMTSGGGD